MLSEKLKVFLIILLIIISLSIDIMFINNISYSEEFNEIEKLQDDKKNYSNLEELELTNLSSDDNNSTTIEVKDESELLKALENENINRIIIVENIELSGNIDRNIERELTIESLINEDEKKPQLKMKSPGRHFYIDTNEKVVFKNLILFGYQGVQYEKSYTGGITEKNSESNNISNIEINGCIFINNYSEIEESAIDLKTGNISIEKSIFANNYSKKGGAIYLNNGSIEIVESIFANNFSEKGGAVYLNDGNLKIINESIFKDNSAEQGGSIYLNTGDIKIVQSMFKRNNAKRGGVIFSIKGKINSENAEFEENTAEEGGVIYLYDGDLSVEKSNFMSNGNAIQTGIIFTKSADIKIQNTYFYKNQGISSSIIYTESSLELIDTIFETNYIHQRGQLINVMGNKEVNINNCKFFNNEVDGSGILKVEFGQLKIKDSNFKSNIIKASGSSLGSIIYASGYEDARIENTIFEYNRILGTIYDSIIIVNKIKFDLLNSNFKSNIVENGSYVLISGVNKTNFDRVSFINDEPSASYVVTVLGNTQYRTKDYLNLNNVYFKNQEKIINLYNYSDWNNSCYIKIENSFIQGDKFTLLYNDESIDQTNSNSRLILSNTFINTNNMILSNFDTSDFGFNLYNNTIISEDSLKLNSLEGLFAHNTVRAKDIEFKDQYKLKNNIFMTNKLKEDMKGVNVFLDIKDDKLINEIMGKDLLNIENDQSLFIRKYFKPKRNLESFKFEKIRDIDDLSKDMIGNSREELDLVTAGSIEIGIKKEQEKEPENPIVKEDDSAIEKIEEESYLKKSRRSGRYDKIENDSLTLFSNGGYFKDGQEFISILKEEKIIEPERENFRLIGWSSRKGGKVERSTKELEEVLENLNSNINFYAIWEKDYRDIKKHTAYIKGYPDNKVLPEKNITREEVAVIIDRILEEDKSVYKFSDINFKDLDETRWSIGAIKSLNSIGIINGYKDNSFRPDNNITRAEITAIISRLDGDNVILEESIFSDIKGHWAESYIESSYKKGWIKGYNDKKFKPDSYITRAEMMSLINSFLGRKVKRENIHINIKEFSDLDDNKWYYDDVLEATNDHKYKLLDDNTEKWIY